LKIENGGWKVSIFQLQSSKNHLLSSIIYSLKGVPDIFVANNKNKSTIEPKEQPMPSRSSHPHGHAHMMSAFCEYPSGIYFANQQKDEEVLLFLRRHFITNTFWIIITILLSLLPIIGILLGFNFISSTTTTIFFYLILYYMVVLTFAFVQFLSWYYNISLVTTKRIVDIDFYGLLYKNVAATAIDKIEDISYTQVGALRSFFDYGDVDIQTAGTISHFDFTAVPHPQKVVQIIEGLITKTK